MNIEMQDIGFLFDLDGVLLDSERSYTRIWADIERDYPTGVKDFPRVIKGSTLTDILNRYFPDPEVSEAVARRCIEAEKDLEFHYMPGAEALLAELKRRGIPRALVTSSDEAKMETLRKKLPDIFGWFNALVYGDMVTHGKPAPEPYLKGAELIGVDPKRCVVVEDALTGIASGHGAGCYVIGVSDTLGREAITGKADIVVDTLDEISVDAVCEILEKR